MQKIVLAIGPESSGTRVLTRVLSAHPQICGTSDAEKHADVLDDVWYAIEKGRLATAETLFPRTDAPVILTRRSMPHGIKPGKPAKYCHFAKLDQFREVVHLSGRRLVVLVTVRNPIANLASWSTQRASAGRDISKAFVQYEESFNYLFRFLRGSKTPFMVAPLESLILDKLDYINCMFKALGVDPLQEIDYEPRIGVNKKHYEWYMQNGVVL